MAVPRCCTTSVRIRLSSRRCVRIRVECDFDVILQPAGSDLALESVGGELAEHEHGGGCGSCDCSDGGGCGSRAAAPASDDLINIPHHGRERLRR